MTHPQVFGPKSGVWVGLSVAFLCVLGSFSLECGVAVPVMLGVGEVGVFCLVCFSVWDFTG